MATASYAEQERRTREYHRRIQSCDPIGAAVNDRVAILNFLYCHEDADVAAEQGLRFLGTFGLLNAHLLFTREVYPTSAYQSPSQKGGPGDRPSVPDGICIGDPRGIISAAKRWESIGVDQINLLLNASEVLSQEQVLASLRLFAKEVMPVFEC